MRIKSYQWPGTSAQAFYACTWDAEADESLLVPGQNGLQSQFQDRQDYCTAQRIFGETKQQQQQNIKKKTKHTSVCCSTYFICENCSGYNLG